MATSPSSLTDRPRPGATSLDPAESSIAASTFSIWMFVRNPCTHDARVLKEARTLTEAGHVVRIIAIHRPGLPTLEHREGFEIIRVPVLPAHYRLLRRYRRIPQARAVRRALLRRLKIGIVRLRWRSRWIMRGSGPDRRPRPLADRFGAGMRWVEFWLLLALGWCIVVVALAVRAVGVLTGSLYRLGSELASRVRSATTAIAPRAAVLARPVRAGLHAPRRVDDRIARAQMGCYAERTTAHSGPAASILARAGAAVVWVPAAVVALLWAVASGAARLVILAAATLAGVVLVPRQAMIRARPAGYELLRKVTRPAHRPLLLRDYTIRSRQIIRETLAQEADPRPLAFHAHDLNTLVPAARSAEEWNGKLVYDSHELHRAASDATSRGVLGRAFVRSYEARLIRKADAVITVNQSLSAIIGHSYSIDPPWVIRNCPAHIAETPRTNLLREELSIPGQLRIALYHGNLAAFRGLPALVQSARHLDDVAIAIMGSGPMREQLEADAQRLGVSERVFLHDAVPADVLLRYVASADVGVIPIETHVPNYYYSLPNKLFELLMTGRPIAAAHLPEIRRLVEQHRIGSIFDPEDPQDIARAILEVLDSPDYASMSLRARAAAREHSWANEAEVLRRVYLALAPSTGDAAPTSAEVGSPEPSPELDLPEIGDVYAIREHLNSFERSGEIDSLAGAERVAEAAVSSMAEFDGALASLEAGGEPKGYSGVTQALYVGAFNRLAAALARTPEYRGVQRARYWEQVTETVFRSLTVPAALTHAAVYPRPAGPVIAARPLRPQSVSLAGWMTAAVHLGRYVARRPTSESAAFFRSTIAALEHYLPRFDVQELATSRAGSSGRVIARLRLPRSEGRYRLTAARLEIPEDGTYPISVGGERWQPHLIAADLDADGFATGSRVRFNLILGYLDFPAQNVLTVEVDSPEEGDAELELYLGRYDPTVGAPSTDQRWVQAGFAPLERGANTLAIAIDWEAAAIIAYPTAFTRIVGERRFNAVHWQHVELLRILQEIAGSDMLALYAETWSEYTSRWPQMPIYAGLEAGPPP